MVRDHVVALCAGAVIAAGSLGFVWLIHREPSDRGQLRLAFPEGVAMPTVRPAVDAGECVIVSWEPGVPPQIQCPAVATPNG
jgi:hypothetical protein